MILNVYGKNKEIIKKCEAKEIDLMYGTVRSLMKLLKVDKMKDTFELLDAMCEAWEELTVILEDVFPDMEEEDWNGVKVAELLPIILDVFKSSFSQILTIPKDPKN